MLYRIIQSTILYIVYIHISIYLGVREARDSPSTPPSHNPAYKIDSSHDSDDLGTFFHNILSVVLLLIVCHY